jgi:hypothetical protein
MTEDSFTNTRSGDFPRHQVSQVLIPFIVCSDISFQLTSSYGLIHLGEKNNQTLSNILTLWQCITVNLALTTSEKQALPVM